MALVGSASDTLAVTDDGHLWPTTSSKVLLEFDHIVTAALVLSDACTFASFARVLPARGKFVSEQQVL